MYGITKVAEIVGVNPITLRAWEQRYGVIIPKRTNGGTRVYTQENINDLLQVLQYKEAHKVTIQQAMKKLKKQKQTEAQSFFDLNPITNTDIIQTIFDALADFDTAKASQIIQPLLSELDTEIVFHCIFVPLLHKVGAEWENGNLQVSQEHFISHFIKQRILDFFDQSITEGQHPKALAICPPNEFHHIGLLLFSSFLQKRGVDVLFLGENTPVENISTLIKRNHVKVVCFSVTMTEQIAYLEQFIASISQQNPDLDFVIGGRNSSKVAERYQHYILSGELSDWQAWFQQSIFSESYVHKPFS